MGFLSPWFLAGLAAVALPLWLHLLRQYKRTPQAFSSLMFFERRVQSSVRHRRLRYLMLLALRLALLILLAVAFANPFINRTTGTTGRRKLTVIVLDRSFSMRAADRMQQAKAEAGRIADGLRGQDLAQLMALDSHLEALTQYERNRGVLRAAIASVEADDLTSSYGEFARALRAMEQTSGMQLDVHLISDMQRTSLPNFRDLRLGPHTTLALHPVGKSNAANWAVENVVTAPQVYDPKQTRLTATVSAWHAEAASKKVSLVINKHVIGTKEVSVPRDGRAQVEFLAFDVPYGASRGEVTIEPKDKLPQDDVFRFAVRREDPRRVLFLYTAGRTNEPYYYKAAMESSPTTGLTVEAAPLERAAHQDFSKYAFVVLNNAGEMDKDVAQALCAYVQKGGAALIALGGNSARAGKIPLAGERFTSEHATQGAGYVDEQTPALAGVGRFQNVQFLESVQFQPKAGARIVAKLADGSPLLIEERMGEGRMLIFTSTLDNTSNDFPLHASFLPFVVQSGHYLAGGDETQSSVVAGAAVALRRTREQSASADVVGPDGKHELGIGEAAKALSFGLLKEGFYEVQRASGHRSLEAVHADRRESDLSQIPAETLDLWRNTGSSQTAATGSVEQQTVPWSLWRYVLAVALAAAIVESIFATRYLKERQTV
ncbi:MAG TPA: BatA and WFA domain-containing protein [Bryobacteraceae bacterium]